MSTGEVCDSAKRMKDAEIAHLMLLLTQKDEQVCTSG
jgi:hypothetical protein